ncbi:N-acetylmuramoyl-L-alanine amidase [Heliorestis convoluta]|uniref:N-acetylmuramoyl-L-alanine amidase n=1 Tax=Heliorestis convoluta TaxID=356322 RepID=A0A5Q2NA58_9FIRM|nr:N-acetylmuramoyl-L-alanine amidase [Heliorestis convoluta]QGG49355.1 N-acetylmuramoyl-L-alanine amidase [Heliorestis convoluta]
MKKEMITLLLGGVLLLSPLASTMAEAGQNGASPGWIHSSWQMLNQQQELRGDQKELRPEKKDLPIEMENSLLPEEQKNTRAVVNGQVVNIRSGPGTSYSILTTYRAGQVVEVIKSQDQWSQIRMNNGSHGWIAQWLLQFPEENVKKEEPKDFKDENPTYDDSKERDSRFGVDQGSWLITTEYSTNIRSGPGWEYSIIKTVPKGQSFELQQVQDNWYQVLEKGQVIGWLASWLAKAEPLSPQEPVQADIDMENRRNVGEASRGGYNPTAPENNVGITPESYLNSSSLTGKTIVIDPGHGNLNLRWNVIDPGAVGQLGTKEKDICLDISLRLEEHLKARGATVILTRRGDGDIAISNELHYRAEVANSAQADLFVSIHNNAHFNKDVGGIATFYYASGSLQGQKSERVRVASMIQQALVQELGRRDIGIREANFVVLRETKMPSVLVEILFISNLEEERLLQQEDIRERSARSIAEALERHFEQP